MKHYNKLFGAFIVATTVLEVFLAGFDVAKHQYGDLAYNVILATFLLALGCMVALSERGSNKEMAKMDTEFKKLMESLIADMPTAQTPKNEKADQLLGVAQALVKQYNLGPNKQPTINEIEAIEIEFHELTDAYMRMTPRSNGLDVKIEDKPFPPRVGTKKPRKARTPMKPLPKKSAAKAGKKIAVKKK